MHRRNSYIFEYFTSSSVWVSFKRKYLKGNTFRRIPLGEGIEKKRKKTKTEKRDIEKNKTERKNERKKIWDTEKERKKEKMLGIDRIENRKKWIETDKKRQKENILDYFMLPTVINSTHYGNLFINHVARPK